MSILGKAWRTIASTLPLLMWSAIGAVGIPYVLAVGQKANLETLAIVLATVGATLLGFVLTALTILAALAETKLIRNMQKTGHAHVLLDELFGAVIVFLIVTALAVVGLFAPEGWDAGLTAASAIYFFMGAGILTIAGTKFYRVMVVLDGSAGQQAAGPIT